MAQKVTVIGLERHAINRRPNGVRCDACGEEEIFDRADADAELKRLAAEGWTIPSNWTDPAFCPKCPKPTEV